MEELKIEELATEGSENTKLSEHSEASENTGRLESPDKSVTEQLEEMLAEAEKRGYLRARNEIAEVAMYALCLAYDGVDAEMVDGCRREFASLLSRCRHLCGGSTLTPMSAAWY